MLRSGTRGYQIEGLARPRTGRVAGLSPVCRPQRWELLPLVVSRVAVHRRPGLPGTPKLTPNSRPTDAELPAASQLPPRLAAQPGSMRELGLPGRAARESDERRAARRRRVRRAGRGCPRPALS